VEKKDPREQRVEELTTLLEISNYVGSVMRLDDILQIIVQLTAEQMGADVCSIFLFDEEKKYLVLRATFGLSTSLIGQVRLSVGEGIPGWVVEHNQYLALADARQDSRHKPLSDLPEGHLVAYLCAPLRIQEEIIGVMTARKEQVYEFSPEEITLFETICKQVAIVIEKSRLYFEKIDAERLAAIGMSLSEISHYIKNILQGVKGGAYFVETGIGRGDMEKARDGWRILRKSYKKIGYLVENMLNFSRTTQPRFEPAQLNDIIVDILGSVEESAHEANINFHVKLGKNVPLMMLDRHNIYNAVLNLITNAIDAIPQGAQGTVTVETSYDESARVVTLVVADNGVGIAEENLPKIFNLFFSTKKEGGTGIGLAVTKKIIEEHEGHISVSSQPGQGTRVVVAFPLRQATGEAKVQSAAEK
jgi:signal transduction histidine kinase